MAHVSLNDTCDVAAPRYIDFRWGKIAPSARMVPYDSVAEALATIPLTRRCEGLFVFIKNGTRVEWWQFVGGYTDDKLIRIIPNGPLVGTITAPSGTIVVPAGLYRELILEPVGEDDTNISVGLTDGGTEIADNVVIPASTDNPAVVMVEKRFKAASTIYITTENDLTYELYEA